MKTVILRFISGARAAGKLFFLLDCFLFIFENMVKKTKNNYREHLILQEMCDFSHILPLFKDF